MHIDKWFREVFLQLKAVIQKCNVSHGAVNKHMEYLSYE